MTLLLGRSAVESLLEPGAIATALRAAFIDYSAHPAARARRVRAALPGPGSATVLFPGIAPNVPAYTVKVHARFPAAQPAIRGVLCLHAAELGEVLGGSHPGRTGHDQVTVYGGVGLAFQDAVAAWAVYEAARSRGLGGPIDLLA